MNDVVGYLKAGAFLVDVREPYEVDENPVPGAVNIPLASLPGELAQFEGKDKVIVFCRSGNRSGMAKKILEASGHTNIVNGGGYLEVLNAIETL